VPYLTYIYIYATDNHEKSVSGFVIWSIDFLAMEDLKHCKHVIMCRLQSGGVQRNQ